MNEPLPHRDANTTLAPRHLVHRDFEGRGRVDLRKVGAHIWARDPATEIMCCAFAVDDGPVQLWVSGDPIPKELIEAERNPDWGVAAHGDHFETAVEQHILAPRYGWPLVPLETSYLHDEHGISGRLASQA
jgi:DNA polymerase bacteriophage-type